MYTIVSCATSAMKAAKVLLLMLTAATTFSFPTQSPSCPGGSALLSGPAAKKYILGDGTWISRCVCCVIQCFNVYLSASLASVSLSVFVCVCVCMRARYLPSWTTALKGHSARFVYNETPGLGSCCAKCAADASCRSFDFAPGEAEGEYVRVRSWVGMSTMSRVRPRVNLVWRDEDDCIYYTDTTPGPPAATIRTICTALCAR